MANAINYLHERRLESGRQRLAPVQAGDAFDVGRVREEIEGLDGQDVVAVLEEGQVPGQLVRHLDVEPHERALGVEMAVRDLVWDEPDPDAPTASLVADGMCFRQVEFAGILAEDYQGHEMLRQRIANKLPKYGNDSDEADEVARRWAGALIEMTEAQTIGPHTAQLVQALMESRQHPQQAYRSCLGILSLARKYTSRQLETVCQRLLPAHLLSSSDEKAEMEQLANQTSPEHLPAQEKVRGPSYYH